MQIPLVGGAYTLPSRYWDGQECVNLYVEMDKTNQDSPCALLGTPGLTTWLNTLGTGEVRAMCVSNGYLWAVVGSSVWKIDSTGGAVSVGTLSKSSGQVFICDASNYVVIVESPNVSWFSYADSSWTSNGSSKWSDWNGSASVLYTDTYCVYSVPSSYQWFLSSSGYPYPTDSSAESSLWASKESQPDNIIGIGCCHRYIWLFGQRDTEVWYNSGSTFPFDRVSGVYLEVGCAASGSIAVLDNTIFWLNDKGNIVRAKGFAPEIISTRAIEWQIASYSQISDARAFVYSDQGHLFYVITFPSADITWVYDCATSLWHRRKSFGTGRWRANCCVQFNGMWLVGDCNNGRIYQIDGNNYTEDGQTIERIRTVVPIQPAEHSRVRAYEFLLDMQTGVGNDACSDPQVALSWSDDGGMTWSNEHMASMGKQGNFKRYVNWQRLGAFRNRQWRVKITDPVQVAIINGFLRLGK